MAEIHCYHCFARFPVGKLHFRCPFCHDQRGATNPAAGCFPMPRQWLRRTPPRYVLCRRCGHFTSFRVCPNCYHDLPHYVGRTRQQVIAVTGCSASGKTVYHWSLLYQLRHHLAVDQNPFVTAMFEDDDSFAIWYGLHDSIYVHRTVPEPTQAIEQKEGHFDPIIVRLLQQHRSGRVPQTNLILYDHAGELVEALDDASYLRYLSHAAAILYLVDWQCDCSLAARGLMAVIRHLRLELHLSGKQRIRKPLAVAVTKADRIPDAEGRLAPNGKTSAFWGRRDHSRRAAIRVGSQSSERFLEDQGFHNFTAIADQNFSQVGYFWVSALGASPDAEGQLPGAPNPRGVEEPLFWALSVLK